MMHLVRKWPIARAEHIDKEGIAWLAESRAGSGTWVIRETDADNNNIVGHMVEFDDNRQGVMLPLEAEIRKALGMSDDVFFELEVQLRRDYEKRQEAKRPKPILSNGSAFKG
jgi:hypothetical protein